MSAQDRFDCPCCGEIDEFKEPGCFEICEMCNWQNDPVQLRDPGMKGGANGLSLNQARQTYIVLGASDPTSRPLDPRRLP
ncbi:hypothetical protein shim_34400 [Shimia sp. SK013]|uniref:CPCC family cysteine-rich protein n=1 Tax=Shimia sp. SK013 TaxID=1389006 RepID=UPI0006B4CCC4|nr:hypothetical protein shim_34400 [Shimia sp. SK013]